MLKQRRTQIALITGASLSALILGATLPVREMAGSVQKVPLLGSWTTSLRSPTNPASLVSANPSAQTHPAVSSLASLPPAQRAEPLTAIAQGPNSLERNRARYLLASDLIRLRQEDQALKWLEGLEQDYAEMAPYVFLKRAQAQTAKGQTAQAQATWTELLKQHGNHPVAAEALFTLGQTNPQYWDQAIAQFPAHPRSHEIARQRLQKNPNQPQLLLLLTRHAFHAPGITSLTDRLVNQHQSILQPADWEAIAFTYWENQAYGKAANAYAKAPRTALNLYRAGRGQQLNGRESAAYGAYQQLVQQFPTAPETATGLLRLAKIAKTPQEGIRYLDTVIQKFPDRAPEALLSKAELLDQIKSPKSASEVRQLLLTRHKDSNAAAELRWQQAKNHAARKDFQGAWQWAQPITVSNATSEIAPEAAFWVGKWAQRLGRSEDAKTAFKSVLSRHPQSYFAWRAATELGLPVGTFTTVRSLSPQVSRQIPRTPLPAGSETLQELYQLGQNQEAWALWQTEFQNPRQPTVSEQFTDGIMRLGVGNNLDGIFMVSSLSWRETPEEKAEYAALKQTPAYWQGLYPFPFGDAIETWARQRQLNPLLVTALIRQESRFEPKIRSVVGATGLMQVMPETGSWVAQQIKLNTYKLDNPEDNINLGTWYLDYTHREYNNNSLFAVASYNAGPGAVAGWIRTRGFNDPDEFIESIPYAETRGYVKHVFENYWNYLRLYDPEIAQLLAQYTPGQPTAQTP